MPIGQPEFPSEEWKLHSQKEDLTKKEVYASGLYTPPLQDPEAILINKDKIDNDKLNNREFVINFVNEIRLERSKWEGDGEDFLDKITSALESPKFSFDEVRIFAFVFKKSKDHVKILKEDYPVEELVKSVVVKLSSFLTKDELRILVRYLGGDKIDILKGELSRIKTEERKKQPVHNRYPTKYAIEYLNRGSILLKDLPLGTLSDVELDAFILAIEAHYSPQYIYNVLKEKGYSPDELGLAQGKSKTTIMYERIISSIEKARMYLPPDQKNVFEEEVQHYLGMTQYMSK